jgi:hypothetical protein
MNAMTKDAIKVIYNDCYGGFGFSEQFATEYEKQAGVPLNEEKRLYHLRDLRMDPVAIKILEEKGTEWSSGPYSHLIVATIPAIFEKYWEIDESDGNEAVRVGISDALADILDTFMETGDKAALDKQYAAIKAAAVVYNKSRFAGTD